MKYEEQNANNLERIQWAADEIQKSDKKLLWRKVENTQNDFVIHDTLLLISDAECADCISDIKSHL